MEKMKVLTAAFAMVMMMIGGQQLQAQDSIDPEFLAAVQGRWITRYEGKDTEIEIVGREGRIVKIAPATLGKPGSQYTPKPGDVFMIITSAKKTNSITSRVDGRVLPNFEYTARAYVDYSNGWRMSSNSYTANLTASMSTCSDGPRTVYLYDQYTLRVFASAASSEYFRPEIKQRWLDNKADAKVTRNGDWLRCAKPGARAPKQRAVGAPATGAANATIPAQSRAATPAAGRAAALPVPRASLPEPSAQELAEIATRERLNREQAAFAAKQVADNAAAKAAFDKATADRKATIAAQEAEQARKQREYDAALAKWRADVEACKNGDITRCG